MERESFKAPPTKPLLVGVPKLLFLPEPVPAVARLGLGLATIGLIASSEPTLMWPAACRDIRGACWDAFDPRELFTSEETKFRLLGDSAVLVDTRLGLFIVTTAGCVKDAARGDCASCGGSAVEPVSNSARQSSQILSSCKGAGTSGLPLS